MDRVRLRPNTPPRALGSWSEGALKEEVTTVLQKAGNIFEKKGAPLVAQVISSHKKDLKELKEDPLNPSNLLKAPSTLINEALGAGLQVLGTTVEKGGSLLRQGLREIGFSAQTASDMTFGLDVASTIAGGVKGASSVASKALPSLLSQGSAFKGGAKVARGSVSQIQSVHPSVTSEVVSSTALSNSHLEGSVSNKLRLRTKLAFEEAGFLDGDGRLTEYAVSKSEIIRLKDSVIGNPNIVRELTKDGSNILDWNKYTTPKVKMPNKQWREIHFYKHEPTGTIDMNTVDFKVKGDILP